jgi:drug/metabolite transporter (DMT)-like permease
MIAGTVPLQIVVLRLAAGESPARVTRLSTLVGLVGLALIVVPGLGAGSTALGLAVMVSATMSWSLGSFLSRRLPLPHDPFVATAYEMSAAGVLLLLGAAAFGEFADVGPEAFGAHSLLAWAYLAVVGSVFAFTAYAWLLRVAPISLVVTHQYVNPVIAIALGVLLLAERPGPLALLGAIVVVSAVYVTVREESRRARVSEPVDERSDAAPRPVAELERAA